MTEKAEQEKLADARAVDRFQSGERSAFDELIFRYEGKIYGFLSRMCGCTENARDVVQETFISAFRYLDRFRGEASFKTWLYRIASTSCMRNKRRRKDEPAKHLSLDDLLPGEAERKSGVGKSWQEAPVDALLNKELDEYIQASLEKLPKKYRIVFVLRELEGFSAEEVSQMLELSIPAVKSRLHRARLFLRKELAEYYLEKED